MRARPTPPSHPSSRKRPAAPGCVRTAAVSGAPPGFPSSLAAEPPSVKVWLDEVNRDELERVSARIDATRKAGDNLCSSAQARSADVDRMRELVATLRETCRGKGVWLAGEASTGARERQRAAETQQRGETIRSQLSRVNAKIGEASETGKVYDHIKKRLRRQHDETERAVATNAAALESLERGRQEHAQNVEAVQKNALHARRELADLRRAIAEHAEMCVGRLSDAEEALASERRWAQRAKSLEEAGKPEIAPDAKEAPQRVQRLRHRASLEEAQLEDLEAAFSNIRNATGLTDVNDIVYKFTNRDQQYFQLQSTSTQTQERIEALKKEQVALRSTLSMVQGTGISFAGNRELYNEIDIRDTRLRRENNHSAAAKTKLLNYRVLLEESKTCIAKITQSLPASADKTLARVGVLEDIPSALEVLERQIAEMLAALGPKIDLTKRPTGATKRPAAGATPASPNTSGGHKLAATERGRGTSGDGSAGDDAMLVDGDAPNPITPRSRRESEALSIMGGAESPLLPNSSTAKDGAGGGGGGLDPQRVAKAKNSGTRAQKLKDGLGRNPSTVGGFDRGARNSAINFKNSARRGSSFAVGSSRDLNGTGAMGASSPGAAQAFIVAQGKMIRAPASLFNQSEAEKLLFKSTMIMQPDNTPKNIRVPRKRFTAPSSVATLINKDYVFREDAMSDEDDVISFNSDEDGVFGAFDIDGDDVDTETAYFTSDRIAMKTLETSHTRSAKKSGVNHPPPAATARLHAVSNHGPNHGAAHGRKGGASGNVQSHATLNGKGGGRGRGNQRSAAVLKPHQGKTGAMRTQRSVLNVGRRAHRKNE